MAVTVTETPTNKAVRLVIAAFMIFVALWMFEEPGGAIDRCEAFLNDPANRVRSAERRRICESWIWIDICSGIALVGAGRLIYSALKKREPDQGPAAPAP